MGIEITKIDLKEDLKKNPWNQKSLNLDQDLRRNHQMNKREIFEKLDPKNLKLN